MNVAVIGTGYVGLVTGTCLAEVGHTVVCMDRDAEKISCLQRGGIPIYEDGLQELVVRNVAAGRLSFTTDLADALIDAEAIFLAIGTPQGQDGSADLSMILEAAEQIGLAMEHPLILIQKSTCPVGTTSLVRESVQRALDYRRVQLPFWVVSNPEFLREGNAVRDFMVPDRVVIGADDELAGRKVAAMYEKLAPTERILIMDPASAELTKYAANAFLATKISFINDIANLCELVGADVENVRRGIGSDNRIGPAFLAAGIGYGGSCFPKDVKALVKTSRDFGHPLRIVESVEAVNGDQRKRQIGKVLEFFGGSTKGKRIAVWGVAFKPGTDDMRESPAIDVTRALCDDGAEVVVYDPVAAATALEVLDSRVKYATDLMSCVNGSDALILLTEWHEFLVADLSKVGQRMSQRIVFDFRNGLSPEKAVNAGFTYYGVGRSAGHSPAAAIRG